ncbi:uncharacterized protein GGS22DRAFT_158964 [Annulohypoxylon maeteangense]|uniref:uncharacterized protein n=1 Tax=Annulohypoxylon maeteangense TaxID=1927788 RepID=UPI002008C8B9|nr:uncharacterized protein GGS22DRAFT_158964 [Annulohypoxylon maeteangense]KAI0886915.1 hypothetical protein GGS22DRAFT_158964 [Annulohypoxylon maeteangense]
MGTTNHNQQTVDVYAIMNLSSGKVDLRTGSPESSLAEIREGTVVPYSKVDLNAYFQSMSKKQSIVWVQHLRAMIPGRNDKLIRWS